MTGDLIIPSWLSKSKLRANERMLYAYLLEKQQDERVVKVTYRAGRELMGMGPRQLTKSLEGLSKKHLLYFERRVDPKDKRKIFVVRLAPPDLAEEYIKKKLT